MQVPERIDMPTEPTPESPRGRPWRWLVPLALVAGGVGAYLLLRPAATSPETGGTAPTEIQTATVETRQLAQTIRVTGTTQSERFVNILVPNLGGSRSGRGRTASTNLISVNTNVNVRSTSTVSSGSSSSSMSTSGTVASTNTTSSSSSSSSNVSTSSSSSSGSSGGGGGGFSGGGGGFRGGRGDFYMAIQHMIPSGSIVKKGDVIAEFDRQYMEQRLEDYEASVAQMEVAFESGKAALAVARKAQQQSEESAKGSLENAQLDIKTTPVRSAITAERMKLALEQAQAQYDQVLKESAYVEMSEQSQLKTAALDVEQAEIELQRTRNNLDRLIIKAPLDGMVVHLSTVRNGEIAEIQEGDDARPGMPFLKIVDNSSMVVEAAINQVDVEKLRIGQKAIVRFDAFPDLALPARVFSIGSKANARTSRREYVTEVPIRLRLDQVERRVIPDLTASAEIVLDQEAEPTVVARRDGVFPGPPGDPASYAYVKRPDGWEQRRVEVGMENYTEVAIRSGLQAGEEIALEMPPSTAQPK